MDKEGMGSMALDVEPLAGVFRLLADKTRLNILLILAQSERNVSSLCRELGLRQPTVSHHLGLLHEKNVVLRRRKGKQVFYSLNGRFDVLGSGLEICCEPYRLTITGSPAAPEVQHRDELNAERLVPGAAG